jgi:tRNA A-37 threonylcarbamoyl transferase component Bud32
MHGDLYAHNILHDAAGNALLGDFGAASFFSHEDEQRAQALQRIEVKAFSCLLEELLQRCCSAGESETTLNALAALQMRCAYSTPAARPLFAEILQILQRVQKQQA